MRGAGGPSRGIVYRERPPPPRRGRADEVAEQVLALPSTKVEKEVARGRGGG